MDYGTMCRDCAVETGCGETDNITRLIKQNSFCSSYYRTPNSKNDWYFNRTVIDRRASVTVARPFRFSHRFQKWIQKTSAYLVDVEQVMPLPLGGMKRSMEEHTYDRSMEIRPPSCTDCPLKPTIFLRSLLHKRAHCTAGFESRFAHSQWF